MLIKSKILMFLNKPIVGMPLRAIGQFTRKWPRLIGLTNPFYVSSALISSGSAHYIAKDKSYLAAATSLTDVVKLKSNSHEPELNFLITKLVKDGDIVLDVGANVGIHTVAFSIAAGTGYVYAFEPVVEMARRLSENCALNRVENVTILPCALGASNEDLNMSVNVDGVALEGTSSLVQSVHVVENPEFYQNRSVKVRTLDSLLGELGIDDRIDFIKMDVEGFETYILEGATKTLKKNKPIMIIEAHSQRLEIAGKSFEWYLETFKDYHIFKVPAVTLTNPYLRLEKLTGLEKNISVNLLFLPHCKSIEI